MHVGIHQARILVLDNHIHVNVPKVAHLHVAIRSAPATYPAPLGWANQLVVRFLLWKCVMRAVYFYGAVINLHNTEDIMEINACSVSVMHDGTEHFLDRPMGMLDTFAHPSAFG